MTEDKNQIARHMNRTGGAADASALLALVRMERIAHAAEGNQDAS